ncbi:ABC transporter permease [Paraburkholderia domus]|nr:hypothetical protein R70006_05546 [Paraburkholderia domus]CAE6841509.1 hypothetical protein R69749_04477 [Paraburkholderia domus]
MKKDLSPRTRLLLGWASFLVPILLWCLVSYVPAVWHPQMLVENPGSVDYFAPGLRVDKDVFNSELANAQAAHKALPIGVVVNPVYFPAPGEVAKAFYTAFTTPPEAQDGQWLYQSLWHSVKIMFWGFLISSIIGVPLGILCGTYVSVARLSEPFTEFFRYLPAPAFGTLAVAILGIYDGPKIAIIVLGTVFQQILVISATTRRLDGALVEAGLTLGARNFRALTHVVLPGIVADVYRDQRILLGWAWTYLIVAELMGATSGITSFISQQARYQHFPKVYAAILMIGILGLTMDMVLARIGKRLFPWNRTLTEA